MFANFTYPGDSSVLLSAFFFDPRKLPKEKTNRETVLLKNKFIFVKLAAGQKRNGLEREVDLY